MLNGAVAKAAPPLSGFVKEALPSSVVESILKLILGMEPEVHLLVELEGHEFGTNLQLDPETLWEINSATPDMVLSLEQTIEKIQTKVAVYGFGRDLSAIVTEVSKQYGELVSVIPSNTSRFFSVVSIAASKSDAIRYLLDSKQISVDNVVAIGDDIPDLDMLAACGMPIAMGNAVPEVKAITRYQTTTNDEDGVAIVLEQVLNTIEK
jgi:hydroxymethylpyrimidine pyrophosphatase-like HAD family hydrolase